MPGFADRYQREIKNSNDRQGGKGGGFDFKYTPELKFRNGEVKRLRFNGSGEEPHLIDFHTHKTVDDRGKEKFNSYVCAKQFVGTDDPQNEKVGELKAWMKEPHPGCVFCHYKLMSKDKSVGGASARVVVSTLDGTLYHKVPNKDGVANSHGTVYVNDEACQGQRCPYCRSTAMAQVWDRTTERLIAVPVRDRHRGGQFKWRIAMKGGEVLWNQILQMREFCACCWPQGASEGLNPVTTVSLACSSCEAPIDPLEYDYSVSVKHACPSCGVSAAPTEVVSCEGGCEGARRATMFDGEWKVTRSGEGVNTTYSFQFMGVSEMPDWSFEYEAPDLTKEERPMSAAKMAEKLGIPDPFQRSSQVSSRSPAPGRAPVPPQRPQAPPPGTRPQVAGRAPQRPPPRPPSRVGVPEPYQEESFSDWADGGQGDDIPY